MEWAKKTHISTYKIHAKLSFDGNYIWHTSSRHVAQESIIKSPDKTWDWYFHMSLCTLSLFFTVRFPYYPLSSTVSSKNMFSIQSFIEIRNKCGWWRQKKYKRKKENERHKKLLNFCHCLQLSPYWDGSVFIDPYQCYMPFAPIYRCRIKRFLAISFILSKHMF